MRLLSATLSIMLLCCARPAQAQECRASWPDTDGDCQINLTDLAVVLRNFQEPIADCRQGDFDRNGVVGLSDLASVLARFGAYCEMQAALVTEGVAPLRVFFSAEHPSILQPGVLPTGSNNYHSFELEWDFGDPNSGTWNYGIGNRSRNKATGVNAAHLYEKPGMYLVSLELETELGLRQRYEQYVNVLPFVGKTYYVANSGNDGNNGLSPVTPIQSWSRAMELLAEDRTEPVQILFERGGQFFSPEDNFIRNRNTVRIGSYGDPQSRRPTVYVVAGTRALWFEGTDDPRDFVIRDLIFQGAGSEVDTGDGFLHCNGRAARGICVINCKAEELAQPVLINYGYGSPTRFECDPELLHSDIWIVDSQFISANRWMTWAGGNRLVFQGNLYTGAVVDHTMRIWRGHRSILQNCRLEAPGNLQQTLKWHNNSNSHYCPPSRYSVVTDNEFVGAGGFVVSFGNQDEEHIEETDDVLFERNLIEFEDFCQRALIFNGRNAMARNNVMNLGSSGGCFLFGITSTHRGSQTLDVTSTFNAPYPQPPPSGNRFFHNTIVVDELVPSPGTCTPDPNFVSTYREVTGVDLTSGDPELVDNYYMTASRNCVVENNWVVVTAENAAAVFPVLDLGIDNAVSGNIASDVASFVDALNRNWAPLPGSDPVDTGNGLVPGAWFDLDGRDRDSLPDAGAYEIP